MTWIRVRGTALFVALSVCICTGGCSSRSLTIQADFEAVQKVVERKLQDLAPAGRFPSGFDSVWYEDRKERREVGPEGGFVRYTVEALRHDPDTPKGRKVSCSVALHENPKGVCMKCDGAQWVPDIVFFEASGTYWHPVAFVEQVRREVPDRFYLERIRWGDPAGSLRSGIILNYDEKHLERLFYAPEVLVYLKNVGETAIKVCPPSTLLFDDVDVGGILDSDLRNRASYRIEFDYVRDDGKVFEAVVRGLRLASGNSHETLRPLAPGEVLLYAAEDLRLGDFEETSPEEETFQNGKVHEKGLPSGRYALRFRLRCPVPGLREPAEPDVWQGAVQCMTQTFTFEKS